MNSAVVPLNVKVNASPSPSSAPQGGLGRAGNVALVPCRPGGRHPGPGEACRDADADGETGGGAAALLPTVQAGGAEDHPHQQGRAVGAPWWPIKSELEIDLYRLPCTCTALYSFYEEILTLDLVILRI